MGSGSSSQGPDEDAMFGAAMTPKRTAGAHSEVYGKPLPPTLSLDRTVTGPEDMFHAPSTLIAQTNTYATWTRQVLRTYYSHVRLPID